MIDHLNTLVLTFVGTNVPWSAILAYTIMALLVIFDIGDEDFTIFLFIVHFIAHVVFMHSLSDTYHWLTLFILFVAFYVIIMSICSWIRFVKRRIKKE